MDRAAAIILPLHLAFPIIAGINFRFRKQDAGDYYKLSSIGLFHDNTAEYGAGIFTPSYSYAKLANNTMENNHASHAGEEISAAG